MSIARRNVLFTLAAAAVAGAFGCNNGGDVIPLAKVEEPKTPPQEAKKTAPPKGTPASPDELIYK